LDRIYQQNQNLIGLSIKYYRNQHHGAGLISSSNRLAPDNDESIWRRAASTVRHEEFLNRPFAIRESRIQGGTERLLVWQWYWINGKFMVNDYVGKLMQAKEKLLLQGDDGAAVLVYAPYTSNPDEARAAIRNFLSGNLASLESTLISNKKH
jgi:EpsI family protein